MMKKKKYEKPSVEVVKLQTQGALLQQVSGWNADKSDYGDQQNLGEW